MARLQLLLLDAGIVIGLHELGLWDKVVEGCDITLTHTVADDEVEYWEDENRNRISIDLSEDISSGRIRCVEVPLNVEAFKQRFDPSYYDRLDLGEAESMAFMLDSQEEWTISSADAIVFKVLGRLGLREQGISLEEILKEVGLSKSLEWKYQKDFRIKYTKEGERDSVTGTGLV